MASVKLAAGSHPFPPGAAVTVQPDAGQAPQGEPRSTPITTALVSDRGVVEFSGLMAGARLWAVAQVGSEWRWIAFLADVDAGELPGFAIEQQDDWLLTLSTDDRSETMINGLRRSLEMRRPLDSVRVAGAEEFYLGQADAVEDPTGTGPDPLGQLESSSDKRYNSTTAALTLRLLAKRMLRQEQPGRRALLPHVDNVARQLLLYQYSDSNKLRYGGFRLAPSDSRATAFGAALGGQAMLDAFRATNNPAYSNSAQLAADFLMRLADPNAYWLPKYGVSPINRVANGYTWAGFCDRVDASDKITTTCSQWNLIAAAFLMDFANFIGYGTAEQQARAIPYRTAALDAADFMAKLLFDIYDYFAVSSNVGDGTYVGTVWPNSTSHNYNDGAPHRLGDVAGTGTVGTDQVEYPIAALYDLGYDVQPLRDIYTYLTDLPHSGALAIASENASDPTFLFGRRYNGAISLAGYLRAGGVIADGGFAGGFRPWRAFGNYYDVQGAGTLGKFKAHEFPDDFALSLPALEGVVFRGSLLDQNLETKWTATASYFYATKGIIPIASAGLALLDAAEVLGG